MKRTEFLAGVHAELPILLGVIPFGLIFGVLAISAGLSPALAQAMSLIVFAGSAQFIAIPLLSTGAGNGRSLAHHLHCQRAPHALQCLHRSLRTSSARSLALAAGLPAHRRSLRRLHFTLQ